MRARWCSLIVTAEALLAPMSGAASTWHVEKDGTGDFTTIQAAIDAASPRDLILIGPGRYDDIHPIEPWDNVHYLLAQVHVSGLTLQGTDPNSVFLGPPSPPPDGTDSWGVFASEIQSLTLRGLTIEHFRFGVEFRGGELTLTDCLLRTGLIGLSSYGTGKALIQRCIFQDWALWGVHANGSQEGAATEIIDCKFSGSDYGVHAGGHPTFLSGCTFDGGHGGVELYAATGNVERCDFRSLSGTAVAVTENSTCALKDCVVESAYQNLFIWWYSHVNGVRNIFRGAPYATIRLDMESTAELHDCHILNGGGMTVMVHANSSPPQLLDLTNNYWGTTDAKQIADWILDHNDDASVSDVVLFEPFLDHPVGADAKSFGGLKSLFGGDEH